MAYYQSPPAYQAFAPPPPPSYGPDGPQTYTPQYSQNNYHSTPALQAYPAPPPPHYGPPPASNGHHANNLPQAFQALNLASHSHAAWSPPPQHTTPQPSQYQANLGSGVTSSVQPVSIPHYQQPQHDPADSGKMTYIARQTREVKASWRNHHRPSDHYDIVLASSPHAQAAYTMVMTYCSKSVPHADLVLYRLDHGVQREIGACTWYDTDSAQCNLKFPFMEWPTPWDPVNEVWLSDTGVLEGACMIWQHDWQDPKVHVSQAKKTILRCATAGEDENGNVCGEKDLEVCKIYLHNDDVDDDCATVELPRSLFSEHRPEQLDEILTIAIANGVAKMTDWTNPIRDPASTSVAVASASTSHSQTAKEATNLVTESLNLAAAIMQAAGGGS